MMANVRRTASAGAAARPPVARGCARKYASLTPLGRQVRVDLRRGDVGVAEHLLQRAQVAAAGQQVRGEGVAQRVRAHPVLQADRRARGAGRSCRGPGGSARSRGG